MRTDSLPGTCVALSGGRTVTWKEPAKGYLPGFGETRADWGIGRELLLETYFVYVKEMH